MTANDGGRGRHALKTAPHHTTWAELRDMWVAADEFDVFESVWHWDHFYPLTPPFDGPNLEAWTTLAALAQATSRIRVGAMVNGMHHRHPAVTANMAATLDHIAGGRFELGMGAGWNELESTALGIELGSMKERFDRFDEGMEVIVSLLTQEKTSFTGEYFHTNEAWCEPKPLQERIPIVIGGKGPKRTLRAVARFADAWDMPLPDSPRDWEALDAVLRAHCDAVGRDESEITRMIHYQLDPDLDLAAQVAGTAPFFAAGVDVVVWRWSGPLEPARLERLATAIGNSR
jgi:F420-dependent oxidoreductase-like protein